MDQLVKLVPSSTSKFASFYLEQNRITFWKTSPARYAVFQNCVRGALCDRDSLGFVFRECDVWVFVPFGKNSFPQTWYFGKTRVDAISGFLRATNREVTPDA